MNYDMMLLTIINNLSGHLMWFDKLIMYISEYGPVIFGLYLVAFRFDFGKSRCMRNDQQH